MHMERERLQQPTRNADAEFGSVHIVLVSQNENVVLDLPAALAPLSGVTVERVMRLGKLADALTQDGEHPRNLILVADIDPNLPQDIGLIQELRRVADPANISVLALIDGAAEGDEDTVFSTVGSLDFLQKPTGSCSWA